MRPYPNAMLRRSMALIAWFGLLIAAPAFAQNLDALHTRILTQRLEQTTAVLNQNESGVRGNIDAAYSGWAGGSRVTQFYGWAVSCQAGAAGYPQGIDIEIDGKLRASTDDPDLRYRVSLDFWWDRQDVRSIVTSWGWGACVPAYPGWTFLLNTTQFTNTWHTARLRIWDTATMRSYWTPYFWFNPW